MLERHSERKSLSAFAKLALDAVEPRAWKPTTAALVKI